VKAKQLMQASAIRAIARFVEFTIRAVAKRTQLFARCIKVMFSVHEPFCAPRDRRVLW